MENGLRDWNGSFTNKFSFHFKSFLSTLHIYLPDAKVVQCRYKILILPLILRPHPRSISTNNEEYSTSCLKSLLYQLWIWKHGITVKMLPQSLQRSKNKDIMVTAINTRRRHLVPIARITALEKIQILQFYQKVHIIIKLNL
jgi:hypothetical protein